MKRSLLFFLTLSFAWILQAQVSKTIIWYQLKKRKTRIVFNFHDQYKFRLDCGEQRYNSKIFKCSKPI